MRLDVELVARGLSASRQKARAAIEAGLVKVNGKVASKPALCVAATDAITVEKSDEYVGRGGKKLEKALKMFIIDVSNCVCADIGASTGGFCDCLLRNNAGKIFAVDIGRDQLDPSVSANPAVVRVEGKNARELTVEDFGIQVDFLSCDLSFISVTLLFNVFYPLLKDGASAVILIKPQFEAGRENVGKGGIVRSDKIHAAVLEYAVKCAREAGFGSVGLTYSPITGGDGNIEYLMLLRKNSTDTVDENCILDTVKAAALEFHGKGANK